MSDDIADDDLESQREGLKRVAVALKEAGVRFALTGGYAAWAHGSPEPDHDVDFLVREEDAGPIAEELERRGLDVSRPPEDWLFKVHVDGADVDVLYRSMGTSVEELLDGAEETAVLSVRMPVVSPTDLVAEKLLALDEHYCDLAAILPTLRALREQVEWEVVERRTEGQPFAEAVLFPLRRLEIIPSRRD